MKRTKLFSSLFPILKRYRHGLMFLYVFIYIPWFAYVEKTVTTDFHVIHIGLDDLIPFNEYFIVPYLIWFFYVAASLIYFFFKDTGEFYRLCGILFAGMTLFLVISTLYPNGHLLRPTTFARENIFVDLVRQLYSKDTATNIFPSIHVYNSIIVHMAIARSRHFKHKRVIRNSSLILMVSIILATVFLKQHSAFDSIGGILLAIMLYPVVYKMDGLWGKLVGKEKASGLDELPD